MCTLVLTAAPPDRNTVHLDRCSPCRGRGMCTLLLLADGSDRNAVHIPRA